MWKNLQKSLIYAYLHEPMFQEKLSEKKGKEELVS